MKKIRFDGNELIVDECYVTMYDNDPWLRVVMNESCGTEADLHKLKTNTSGIVELFHKEDDEEEWELDMVYDGYDSEIYTCSYNNGYYTAMVKHMDEIARQTKQNAADIQYLAIMADIPL